MYDTSLHTTTKLRVTLLKLYFVYTVLNNKYILIYFCRNPIWKIVEKKRFQSDFFICLLLVKKSFTVLYLLLFTVRDDNTKGHGTLSKLQTLFIRYLINSKTLFRTN